MKTPLIERMEKAKAPKTWIREIKTKDNRIERLLETKETYLNIIDRLAREKEQLAKYVEDGRYAYSVIKECHRKLEAENEALKAELRGERERLLLEMYNSDTISQVQFDHAMKELALLTGEKK